MTRLFFLTAALALALLAVESVAVQLLGLAIVRVDVTVVLVCLLGLRAPLVGGAATAFAVGWSLDLMSGQPTGLYTFLAVLVFLGARVMSRLVDVRTRPSFALFAMGADAAHGVLAAVLTWMTAKEGGAALPMLRGVPLTVALTGAAAFALYPLLKKFDAAADRASSGLGMLR